LQLFQIAAVDAETGLPLFDSRDVRRLSPPAGWKPRFVGQRDLDIYGRTWRLNVVSTPAYEQGLLVRAQNLVLSVGLSTALLLGLVVGAYVFQRDRQMHASQQAAARLGEQAQQLTLINRYKSEFLANMSHELRTPLNSILILSDQMRQTAQEQDDDKQTRHAEIIYRAGSDLLQLINDVLDLAKIESGHLQLTLEPLDLQDMLMDLDAALQPLAEAKQLHLHIPPLAQTVPQRVFGDRVRMYQVLRNLLTNAIKFTDAGQVHLGVSAGFERADGSVMLTFEVRDTGIGIATEHQTQVFEAFQQVDGTSSQRFGGTGLGLPITRQLVATMGGEVSLTSVPGRGSTFTVRLPMRVVPGSAPGAIPVPVRTGAGRAVVAEEPVRAYALSGRRVLLVDDDVRTVYAMSAALDRLGVEVLVANHGEEAIASFLAKPPDLILMDMSMPVMDGYTTTQVLKQEHGCTIPIIALTARVMKGDREKCLAVGTDDYLVRIPMIVTTDSGDRDQSPSLI